MTHFVQLDLLTLPAGSQLHAPSELLQLFYCTNMKCGESEGAFAPFSEGSVVRTIDGALTASPMAPTGTEIYPTRIISAWERFDDLPSASEHEELGLHYKYDRKNPPGTGSSFVTWADHFTFGPVPYSADLAEAISTAETGDKLGGWPSWIQGIEYPACPRCAARMEHMLQIDSEDHVPYMFGDCGCGHVTRCPNHPGVQAFGWACS
jgi:hypothetical protein